jgi:uncharacterized membrane protein YidH (DUF202 family)
VSAGLQGERTQLAWTRTALSCWVAGLIALRGGFPWSLLALVAPLTVTGIARARRRYLRDAVVPAPLDRGAAAVPVLACVLVALVGAVA